MRARDERADVEVRQRAVAPNPPPRQGSEPDPPRPLTPAGVFQLQRRAGNAAVADLLGHHPPTRLLQRDDEPSGAGPPAGAPGGDTAIPRAAQALVGSEFPVSLSVPDPLNVPDTGAVGDFPTPQDTGQSGSPPTALRDDSLPAPLQRDDDSPHVSGDAAAQAGGTLAQTPNTPTPAPVQLNVTLIYRNLDLWQSKGKDWEVVHEPQIQLIGDSGLTVSIQEAVTLVNMHWMPPWQKEIEVGLSAFAQQQLLPAFGQSYGTQLQVEQHLTPWFSITGTLSGTYAPPQADEHTGVFSLGATGGVLIHFDGFGGGS